MAFPWFLVSFSAFVASGSTRSSTTRSRPLFFLSFFPPRPKLHRCDKAFFPTRGLGVTDVASHPHPLSHRMPFSFLSFWLFLEMHTWSGLFFSSSHVFGHLPNPGFLSAAGIATEESVEGLYCHQTLIKPRGDFSGFFTSEDLLWSYSFKRSPAPPLSLGRGSRQLALYSVASFLYLLLGLPGLSSPPLGLLLLLLVFVLPIFTRILKAWFASFSAFRPEKLLSGFRLVPVSFPLTALL